MVVLRVQAPRSQEERHAEGVTRHAVSNPAAGIPRGLLATCIAVVAVVVIPIVVTIVQAIQGGASAARDALGASSTTTLLLHTVLLAAIATPAAGVIGVAGAWFVERTRLPFRRVWAVLLVAPLTVPLFVTSYAWATLGRPLQGFWGAAAIVAFSYFPIVYLLVAVSLRGLDPALEETARSLGLNARQTFFRVILPQLRPAMLGGLLLVALDALVEFDAFVALKFQTFSLDIYAQYRLGFSASGAAALSFFSIVLCLVLLFGEAQLRGHANYTRVSQGARRASIRYDLGTVDSARARRLRLRGRGQRRHPRRDADRLVLAEQSRRSLDGEREHQVPAACEPHLDRSRCLHVGAGGGSSRFPIAAPRRPLSRPGRDRPRARDLPLVRASGPRGGDRARLRGEPLPRVRSTARFALLVFAEAILFLPFAVVAIRATLGQIEPSLEDSARSLGLGPAAHASGGSPCPLARPGFVAAARPRLRLRSGRSLDRPGAASARHATRSEPSSRPTARPSHSQRPRRSRRC